MNYETLYKLCLRLYPSDFRDEFGDEMLGVFSQQINDVDGVLHVIYMIFKELADVIWNAIGSHINGAWHGYNSLSDELRTLHQARWIIRIASLMNALFFVWVTLEPYARTPEPEKLAFLSLFSIQLVCVFFALKWERIGGLIMLTSTLTIAPIIFLSTAFPGLELLSLLATILWTIPFSGFAMAYLVIGQRRMTIQQGMLS